jgi:hypothetical protein
VTEIAVVGVKKNPSLPTPDPFNDRVGEKAMVSAFATLKMPVDKPIAITTAQMVGLLTSFFIIFHKPSRSI